MMIAALTHDVEPDPTKAAHYIKALDEARCDGNWSAVPEFVRKIRKHAPDRTCLSLTAETECAIAKATDHSGAGRPSNAINAKDLDATNVLPKLQAAIDGETRFPEERFQAQVCAALLHWVLWEFEQAAAKLPNNLEQEIAQFDPDKISEWTSISALKAAVVKANCLSRSDDETPAALAIFDATLPSVTTPSSTRGAHKQFRVWSELFLTDYCILQSEALRSNERSLEDSNSLACFRSWAQYWEAMSGPVTGGYGYRGSVPRRQIWLEYYLALTTILELDLPYPTGYLGKVTNEISARHQLRIELKKAEAAYEALLISETSFPRADETREEVESFVRAVTRNWSILCGRGWNEQDLGQGGRESISRGVLDTLYAAATKTYHSTAILRCLFTVHLAVAEFDLAFKAFYSYLDLVRHGKARVDKTGHIEANLDDDGTVLETMSQCILAMCRYGGREAIEKARDIGNELEDWLSRLPQLKNSIENENTVPEEEEEVSIIHPKIKPHLIALSWQAIGLSQAHWSRITYDAASRTEIQTRAIRCLRKSLSPELGRTRDVRSLFALGLLLAERRDLTPAIEIVKTALISNKSADEDYGLYHGPYWQERSLVPLWHLLALLLSARQDFHMAVKACEGAFEQFRDTSVLFGRQDVHFKSEHLNDAEARDEKVANERKGLVDDMDDTERESILEVKMTQLALVELLEGPDVAVNGSSELLSLFTRLFGNLETKPTMQPPKTVDTMMPPKSSAGTLRSIRGSIFGSQRARRASIAETEKTTTPSRPQTTQTSASIAPTIQVTQENGSPSEKRSSRRLSSLTRRGRSESGKRHSLRNSSGGRKRAASTSSAGTNPHVPTVVDGEPYFTPGDELQQSEFPLGNRQASTASSVSRGRSLHHLESYASQKSRSTNFSEISASATYTISNPLPLIHFSHEHERRQRNALLVKVWLMIAGFYRRAHMFEDSKGAISEAQKLVGILEAEVQRDTTGSLSLKGNGWAERKGVDELLGDVWAELGNLSLAKGAPYLARSDFESALTHFPDHPTAVVSLSNILLDIYTEKILPPSAVPSLEVPENISILSLQTQDLPRIAVPQHGLPSQPLGLGSSASGSGFSKTKLNHSSTTASSIQSEEKPQSDEKLPAPYKATSVPKIDRLASRDRAYGLLSSLTKLGSAWNNSEAWFALARAHEESGQVDKAKEVLWWCVELEEGTGVREWQCLGSGGYVL
ncbi:putative cargo-transport protein ypp1 [Colletotrichum sidae]|uniref:Putative cargo-transport protein ypp1 n=1 Tax=Colletotrichum sidae TaxID=1347389 RepID=A0A4R8T336_9PEZI|nr:putative cargo-transport protein ypp1 [Colletotrichum sidae]